MQACCGIARDDTEDRGRGMAATPWRLLDVGRESESAFR
jgi:hypothetical protein